MRTEWKSSLVLLLASSLAFAHPGHGLDGFTHGFYHPLQGADHLITALAVGVWGAMLGGSALFAFPVTFVLAMGVGSLLGLGGQALPFHELGILFSVALLGLALCLSIRIPVSLALPILALFASFHGNAHGIEMHSGISAMNYVLGFALSTAGLHFAGIAVVLFMKKVFRDDTVQLGIRLLGIASLVSAGLMNFGIL